MAETGTPGSAAYRAAGVDYDALDAGKRIAMAKALATSRAAGRAGGRALDASRGEPAFVFELDGRTFAFVVEGLGTKSIIARQVLERAGVNRFADVAYDTVAAIVNDLCCVGALPLVVNAYFATGVVGVVRARGRTAALLEGWRRACADAGATWGGGESPSLPGLLDAARHRARRQRGRRRARGSRADPRRASSAPGDEIVLVASSGLHANGASLARLIAERLARRLRDRAARAARASARRCSTRSLMYAPLVARAAARRAAAQLPQPHHRSRPAQADAPARAS